MAVATYCYYEKVRKTMRAAVVSYLLNRLSHTCSSIGCDSEQEQRNYCIVPQIWNSIYGKAQMFLTDHAGEFANRKFLEMAEQLGINAETNAAESP